jgi:hypothetical protein
MTSGKTERIELRLDLQILDKVDKWRAKEADLPMKLQMMLAARMTESADYMTAAQAYAWSR